MTAVTPLHLYAGKSIQLASLIHERCTEFGRTLYSDAGTGHLWPLGIVNAYGRNLQASGFEIQIDLLAHIGQGMAWAHDGQARYRTRCTDRSSLNTCTAQK